MKVVFTSVKSLDSNYGNTIRLLFAPSGIGEGPGNINFPSVISGNSIGKIYTFSVISPTVLISPNSSLSQNNRLATVRITNNDTNTGITLSGITLSFSASTTAPSGLTFNSTLCLRDM